MDFIKKYINITIIAMFILVFIVLAFHDGVICTLTGNMCEGIKSPCLVKFIHLLGSDVTNNILMIFITALIAVFTILQWQNNHKANQSLSFDYMSRWTSADIRRLKRSIISDFKYKYKDADEKELLKVFNNKDKNLKEEDFSNFCLLMNALEVCNFFEELAIFIHHKTVNENMLKDYFKGIIKTYYCIFSSFISSRRKLYDDKNIFIEFENLYKKWYNLK